jgi:hypothetical protein
VRATPEWQQLRYEALQGNVLRRNGCRRIVVCVDHRYRQRHRHYCHDGDSELQRWGERPVASRFERPRKRKWRAGRDRHEDDADPRMPRQIERTTDPERHTV